jgi:hypothetical protein
MNEQQAREKAVRDIVLVAYDDGEPEKKGGE